MTIAFTAGQQVTAAQMNLLCPVLMKLTADVANTTSTLTSATDLSFTLLPNTTYQLDVYVGANSSVAGTLGLAIGYTTTGTVSLDPIGLRRGNGPVPTTSATTASTSTAMHTFLYNALGPVTYGTDTAAISSGVAGVDEHLLLDGGLSGGTITLQFAKATATAGTTTLKAGSWAVLRAVA